MPKKVEVKKVVVKVEKEPTLSPKKSISLEGEKQRAQTKISE